MKKLLALLLAAFIAAPAPFVRAATDPVPTSVITMIGSNPTFDAKLNLLTAPVQAMFQTTVVVSGITYATQESVSWDGTSTEITTTVDGIKLTAKQITTGAAQIAAWIKANPPPKNP